MRWGLGATKVARKIADYHKELVTTSVRYEELRRQTQESLAEFKAALDKVSDRVGALERECIAAHSDLNSKINTVSERLTIISEKAIHVVAFDAVKQATRERLVTMELENRTSELRSEL
jgi:uncharacterized phage infection (PIP) family protein YhgE